MSGKSKQEELTRKVNNVFEVTRIDYEGVYEPDANTLLVKLINSEVLQALEELSQNKETLYWWTGGEYEKTTVVDMRAIQTIKERYQ